MLAPLRRPTAPTKVAHPGKPARSPQVLVARPDHPEERALAPSGARIDPSLGPRLSSSVSNAGYSELPQDRVAPVMTAHTRALAGESRQLSEPRLRSSPVPRMHVGTATDDLLGVIRRPAATIAKDIFVRSDVWNGRADRRARILTHEQAHVARAPNGRSNVLSIHPYPNEYTIPTANYHAEDLVDLFMKISLEECEIRIGGEKEKWQVVEIRSALARRRFSDEASKQRARAVNDLLSLQLEQIEQGKAGPPKLSRATVTFGSVADKAENETKGRTERISEARLAAHKTNFQYPTGGLADVATGLDFAAIDSGNAPRPAKGTLPSYPSDGQGFVARLHFIGHGSTGDKAHEVFYDFGVAYTAKDLREARAQGYQFSRYMVDGARIHLEGCSVGAGELGRQYLCEVGETFLGNKSGTIIANTCESQASPNADEVLPCGPIEFAWPAACKK